MYIQKRACSWRGSQSLRYYTNLISLSYDLKDAVALTSSVRFVVQKHGVAYFKNRGGEQDAGRTSYDDKSYIGESRNELSVAESTGTNKALDLKSIAASMPQGAFIATFGTWFAFYLSFYKTVIA